MLLISRNSLIRRDVVPQISFTFGSNLNSHQLILDVGDLGTAYTDFVDRVFLPREEGC